MLRREALDARQRRGLGQAEALRLVRLHRPVHLLERQARLPDLGVLVGRGHGLLDEVRRVRSAQRDLNRQRCGDDDVLGRRGSGEGGLVATCVRYAHHDGDRAFVKARCVDVGRVDVAGALGSGEHAACDGVAPLVCEIDDKRQRVVGVVAPHGGDRDATYVDEVDHVRHGGAVGLGAAR